MEYDAINEVVIGVGALIVSGVGAVLAQADPALGSSLMSILTQFGGLGLAVWLAYYHTTVTIPTLHKQHKEERIESIKLFTEQLDTKRREYLAALKELADEHKADLERWKEELNEAIRVFKENK